MDETRQVQQGDIYFARIPPQRGSIQAGDRPVVVISSNWLNRASPVFRVALLTSQLKAAGMPTHVVLPMLKGLPKQSMVLAEQTAELIREDFLSYRCTLSEELYKEVDRAVRNSIRMKRRKHRNRRKGCGHRSHINRKNKRRKT